MGNIQVIENEKNLSNQFFWGFFFNFFYVTKGILVTKSIVRINLAIDWMIEN
jgi:hypothetical protein